MNRFENVDLIDSLRRIMETNTAYYQSDFNFDEKKLCICRSLSTNCTDFQHHPCRSLSTTGEYMI